MRKAKAMNDFRLPSSRLLPLLGATLLYAGGAIHADAGQQRRSPSAAKQKVGLKQIALLSGERKAAAPPPTEIPKLQVGDLTITGASRSGAVFGTGASHWTGPNTEVEVLDRTSKSVLRVHADDVQASRVGKNEFGLITLNGNVRYRLVQQSDEGERVLEGTAGRAEVRRVTHHMEFTGGVHADVTDKVRFSGPATLRTRNLTVAMETKPFQYTLEGVAANNDIQFTPLQTPTVKAGTKPASATPLGTIHIFGFRSGDLQFGKAIHLQGAATTCEFGSPDDLTSWRLQGEQFEGEFVPDTSDLQRATVSQNVRFHITQPSADKKAKTMADGTAPQASYVRSQAGQELVAHGPFRIEFTDAQHLVEPMLITAEESSVLSVKKVGDSLSYDLDDPNRTGTMRIVPKPLEKTVPKPTTPLKPK
jgi:hypothetical protein